MKVIQNTIEETRDSLIEDLRTASYDIGSISGELEEFPSNRDAFSILVPHYSRIFKNVYRQTQPINMGTLWLNNQVRGAKLGDKFVLELTSSGDSEGLVQVLEKSMSELTPTTNLEVNCSTTPSDRSKVYGTADISFLESFIWLKNK